MKEEKNAKCVLMGWSAEKSKENGEQGGGKKGRKHWV